MPRLTTADAAVACVAEGSLRKVALQHWRKKASRFNVSPSEERAVFREASKPVYDSGLDAGSADVKIWTGLSDSNR
jgi:hypothetical protein